MRYRICLRTYSAQESKVVLATPDAFLLPPYPGVGYLSVDTDVYQRFKTALIAIPHVAADADRGRAHVSVFELSAPPAPSSPGEREQGAPTDLDILVARLRDQQDDEAPVHQVWLAPLPVRQPLSAVLGRTWMSARSQDPASGLRAPVGLLDRPASSARMRSCWTWPAVAVTWRWWAHRRPARARCCER